MTIADALEVVKNCETMLAVRRRDWGEGDNALYVIDGAIWYRRFPNAYGWPWKPTLEDLVANDWVVVEWRQWREPCTRDETNQTSRDAT